MRRYYDPGLRNSRGTGRSEGKTMFVNGRSSFASALVMALAGCSSSVLKSIPETPPVAAIQAPANAIGTFAGEVTSNGHCFTPTTNMRVTIDGAQFHGMWVGGGGRDRNFAGSMSGPNFQLRVETEFEVVRISGMVGPDGTSMSAEFYGLHCRFAGTLTKKDT
jgi:hypothetical protein